MRAFAASRRLAICAVMTTIDIALDVLLAAAVLAFGCGVKQRCLPLSCR